MWLCTPLNVGLNFCGLLAFVAVFYFEMERKWNIFSTGIKKELRFYSNLLILLVGRARFERATIALKVPPCIIKHKQNQ
jgi:hypothetical protein